MHGELITAELLDEPLPAIILPSDSSSNPTPQPAARYAKLAFEWLFVRPFRLVSLIVLLAVASAAPIVQLVVLGYLLEVSARIARSGRLRDGLFLLEQAGMLGIAAMVLFLASLPISLLSQWAFASELVNPGNFTASALRGAGGLLAVLILVHVGWVWFRGNARWWSYMRPRPFEIAKGIWRPTNWIAARDRLWLFVASLQIPKLFWLGFRGMVATLLWLAIPGSILIGAIERGTTGLAGLAGFVGFVMMGTIMLYLPFLQVRFAAENRFKAMFEVGPIRRYFTAAPLFFFLGLAATFLFSVPLYLLKIEATPREVTWAPCIVMVAFTLPARLMTGLAVGRAARREPGSGRWTLLLRILIRLLSIPLIVGYLLIVFLSGFTSWDGLATWFQQHALLIPVPFNQGT